MTANELKLQSHNLIDSIRDKKTLELLYNIISSVRKRINKKEDWWDELSEQQKFELEQSILESYDSKNLVPHDDVVRKIDSWLKK
ncbi:MAG: hypothetical protein ABI723_10110 [Bacteroidia bacterium]